MSAALRGPTTGAYRWADITLRFGARLPVYPALGTVVPVARVPEPPLLAPGDTEPARALHLALAYRTVVAQRYGRCFHKTARWCRRFCGVVDEDDIMRMRPEFAYLTTSAELLLNLRIAPLAWVAFSVDVYRQYAARKSPPGVVWTYAPTRIEERKDWFGYAEQKFRGGRLIIEPEHRELITSFERMRYALMLVSPLSESRVDRIVRAHLSPQKYERLVDALEDKTEEKRREFRRAIQRREWIW